MKKHITSTENGGELPVVGTEGIELFDSVYSIGSLDWVEVLALGANVPSGTGRGGASAFVGRVFD